MRENHFFQSRASSLPRVIFGTTTSVSQTPAFSPFAEKGQSNTIFFLTETSSGSAGILSLHFAKRRMGRMILNNALRAIVNAEKRGKATVELQPVSTVMSSFLRIMKNRGYIKDFQVFEPHRVGKITVQLQGRVNDCRALTYRQDVKARDIEEYKMRKLPTHQWGYVVITTPEGVMDHEEAVTRNVGGQVLGYFH